MATLKNENAYSLVSGGADNDYIENYGDTVTINAGAGNDSIRNWGDSVTIDAGVGNDSIYSSGNSVTIDAGAGNDSIVNWGNEVLINAGAGSDSIRNTGGQNVKITADSGDNYIYNYYDTDYDYDAQKYETLLPDKATIVSGTGNDTIYNYGNKASISSGAGNDYIINGTYSYNANFVTINAGAGDDTIYNWGGQSVKIYAGDGDNYIYNNYTTTYNSDAQKYETLLPDKATIVSGTGNDTIYNYGNKASISSGAGNDYISNDGSQVSINGGVGNDSIDSFGNSVTIDAGVGNDSIDSSGNSVIINAGAGHDSIYNWGDSVTIDAGAGNDTIKNYAGQSVKIYAGDGDNYIYNGYTTKYNSSTQQYEMLLPNKATIAAGAGKDTIHNYGNKVSISGGDGNDSIDSSGNSVTIDAGVGNDSIYSSGNSVIINAGAGHDSIYNWGDSVTIDAGAGNDTIKNYAGQNVKIYAGDGDNYIYNGYTTKYNSSTQKYEPLLPDKATIVSGTGNDTIYNYGNKASISSGAGNDYISNDGSQVSINGGDGNDSIDNQGDSVTINAGAGNDDISNFGDNVTISTGAGDDSVYNYGENVLVKIGGGQNTVNGTATVNMGTSNATVTGDCETQIYQYGGGNDVITNYSHEDIIHIASGKLDSYSFDGGDLIFHIGKGSLRLKNMTNHAITVKDSSGKTTTKIYSNGYSPQQVIKNLVQAWSKTMLSGTTKLDESIKLCSQFNSIQEVIDKMVADCRAVGDADTFLRNYCGIITDNDDTGAITGWDAGGFSAKTSSDIVGETLSSLKHLSDYTDATFKTSQGTTINISSTGDSLTADGKKVFDALYSWWADETLKLIEESYGVKFTDNHKINFELVPDADFRGQTGGTYVRINMGATNFYGDDDYNGNGVDRCITHEFTHVAQNLFMGYFPQFLEEGLAELTHGIDNRRNFSQLASDADYLNKILDVNKDGTGDSVYYAAGFMFYRYLAKQISDAYDSLKSYAWKENSSIVGTSDAEFLTGSGQGVTISAGKGNDTITSYGEKMKVFGEDGDDTIGNKGAKATISGGAGNDSIHNWSSNVLITGGAGNDSIRNTGGQNVKIDASDGDNYIYNDSTTEYNSSTQQYETLLPDKATIATGAGKDTIHNYGNKVSISAGAGDDTIYNWGGQSVKIYASDGDNYIYNDSTTEYNSSTQQYETLLPDKATIVSGTGNDTIYNYGNKASISSGAGNDSIINGTYSYNANFVTIDAGAGDDTIYNWGGQSVKIYAGDGDNYIYNDYTTNYNSDTQQYETLLPDKSTIVSGAGVDSISNYGNKTSINSGAGNDSIDNHGSSITIDAGTDNDIIINGGYWESDRGGHFVTINGGSGNDTLISHGSTSKLNGSDGNDYIANGYRYDASWNAFYDSDSDDYKGNNSTIGGGTGNDTIKNRGNKVLFQYKSGDGNDFIEGFNATSTLSIVGGEYSSTKSNDNIIFTIGKGKVTLSGAATLSKVNIIGTPVTLLSINDKTKSPVTAGSTIKFIDASARTTPVKITGNALANTLLGGTGNDTLNGGTGNDTLTGGKGNDVFIYSAGNDVITDYVAGDKISLGAAISKTSLKGSDATFTINKNTLTVKNGKGKKLTVINSSGKTQTLIGGAYISDNNAGAATTLATWREVGDASARTKAVKLTGNAKNNTLLGGTANDSLYGGAGNDSLVGNAGNDKLFGNDGNDRISGDDGKDTISGGAGTDVIWGGKGDDSILGGAGNDSLVGYNDNDTLNGGKGNDTLTGGKGNDSLWGDEGKDTFLYADGDGKDVIFGFEDDDMLKIIGTFSGTYNKSKKEVYFKVGSTSNAITLKDFSATTFNLNGDAYKINATKLVKK